MLYVQVCLRMYSTADEIKLRMAAPIMSRLETEMVAHPVRQIIGDLN